jgi:hypothetical protein
LHACVAYEGTRRKGPLFAKTPKRNQRTKSFTSSGVICEGCFTQQGCALITRNITTLNSGSSHAGFEDRNGSGSNAIFTDLPVIRLLFAVISLVPSLIFFLQLGV